jgi:putative transposase
LQVSELTRLKELEEENRRLKQMYADLSLENQVGLPRPLRRCCEKSSTAGPPRPADKRRVRVQLIEQGLSKGQACSIVHLSRRMYGYQSLKKPDQAIEQAIEKVTSQHPSWGCWKVYHRLRKDGLVINHKRLWRVYGQLQLNLPRKKKKRLLERIKQPLSVPAMANQMWSMDLCWMY